VVSIIESEFEFEFCSACGMGKAQRLHSSLSHTHYTIPLRLIYSDWWGPAHVPYIAFVDTATMFTWIYC
jgi:hypothetical protein